MISISETEDEYRKALETHIETTAKILGFKVLACFIDHCYRVDCHFVTEDETTDIDIRQQLKVEDNLNHKVIPRFNQTGYERFHIQPYNWAVITKDSEPYMLRATEEIPFTPHSKWDEKGHVIRLIKADRIPKGVTHITINNDTIEFLAKPSIDANLPIDILLGRFAFMHNTIHDYCMDGCDFNETIGQAKANII